jgi:hypothetical protein
MTNNIKAFPFANDADKEYNWINHGMDLRDYFAGLAMQASMAMSAKNWQHKWQVAQECYEMADEMIKAREVK